MVNSFKLNNCPLKIKNAKEIDIHIHWICEGVNVGSKFFIIHHYIQTFFDRMHSRKYGSGISRHLVFYGRGIPSQFDEFEKSLDVPPNT